MFIYVKVFGERNSGTIYLTALVRENTNAIMMEGDTRGKAGLLKSENRVFPEAYTHDNDYVQDMDHFRMLHSDFGWKHARPPIDVIEFSAYSRLTKFIYTTKHPCFWLQSMFNRPYNPRLSRAASFSDFIRSPWPLSRRDNIDGTTVATPIELFNKKVRSYMEMLRKYPDNSVFVRYEDLLEDTEQTVTRACSNILGFGESAFKNILDSTKSAGENFDFYRKKYLSENYVDSISDEDLDFIDSKLDKNLMERCGYSVRRKIDAGLETAS